ncbi:MAG: isopentenyl-diphosphate Delta-isomerase [Gammaproteobacteria bacterium]|nr:isopentenyl-diphosphate Delta-isomerase [Gammaproteobacteria bacterium]
MTATEYVILVDTNNQEIGQAEKLVAHQKNLLHRAFSVFIFRQSEPPELLLQQRALHKYHSPGLWTNTCCSHPRQGETVVAAGERRLQEEMGIATSLTDLGWFHYNAHFSNGLSEHEIDHVLLGHIAPTQTITPNPEEVNAYKWVNIEQLEQALTSHPAQFTPWLAQALGIAKGGI